MMTPTDIELRRSARKVLTRHQPAEPSAVLAEMARSPYAELPTDLYGEGGAVTALEQRVAKLLGKPAGLFFMKGVIAQQCVLRRRSEERQSAWIALHPLCHIDCEEENALEHLHALKPVRLGKSGPFTVDDLRKAPERLACVVVELPLRRAGYLLPPWDELVSISTWCRERSIPFHIDGARLWESAAGYGCQPEKIAALADSIYVSFYKGLGGLAGCVVAGEADFLASLKPWKTRHGGNLFAGYPYAIVALIGLDRHLPHLPRYVERARSLAPAVAAIPAFRAYPMTPHVNAFSILMPGRPEHLIEQNRAFARDTGVWLFNDFQEGPLPDSSIAEIVIGDTSETYTDDEAVGWLRQFSRRCAASSPDTPV